MRSPSSTKSVVRNGKKKTARKKWRTSTKSLVRNGRKKTARKKWPTSTKSVVRNGKKPRKKNGVKKKTLGAKARLSPQDFAWSFFPRRLFTVTQDGQKRDYS